MSDCLFCRIIRKEIQASIVYEDQDILALHDIHPQAPQHLLVIPKKHIPTISDMKPEEVGLIGKVIDGARNIASQKGWEHYRLVFNNGAESGQSVFHVHLHLLSGRRMGWPPG